MLEPHLPGSVVVTCVVLTLRRRTPTERRQDYERTKERIFSASGDAALQANGCGRGGSLDASEGGAERLGFGGGRGRGSAGAGAGGKALLRNRDEERCDPDFQRDPSRCAAQHALLRWSKSLCWPCLASQGSAVRVAGQACLTCVSTLLA